MVFEVNSIEVARGIEYVVRPQNFRSPNLVVFLPVSGTPFPKICHSKEWENNHAPILSDLTNETVEYYKKLNAIVITVEHDKIMLIDLTGATLKLRCSYKDALSYLEYVLLWRDWYR